MSRLTGALWAALATCGLVLGAAIWLRSALVTEFLRGAAAGRAEIALANAQALEAARAAAQSAAARTQRDVAALSAQRESLQESLDGLDREIAKPARGEAAVPGAECFGPDLLRALSAIGRDGAGVRPRP